MGYFGRLLGSGGAPPGGGAYPIPTTNLMLALALRKLVPAYAGPAIRVRRSTDNTELDVGFDTNGDLDLVTLAGFLGAAVGHVAVWYDQSAQGVHAAQSTAANQPIVSIAAIGGRPGLSFDAPNTSTRHLNLPPFAVGHTGLRSAVVTARLRTATFAGVGSVGNFGLVGTNTGIYVYADVAANKWHSGGPWDVQYADGVLQADRLAVPADMSTPHVYAFTHASSATISQGRIGSYRTFNGGHWRGEVAEVLYYESVLTTADRQSIESSAMAYFGI